MEYERIISKIWERNTHITAAENIGEICCIGHCIHSTASSYWSELGFVRPILPLIQSL